MAGMDELARRYILLALRLERLAPGFLDSYAGPHAIRTTSDPVLSTYPFTYTVGARLIRPWLATVGPIAGFRRLLSQQLSPAQLLAET